MPMSTWLMRAVPATLIAGAVALMVALPATAGPVADFEKALRGAYGDYRMALMQTNLKNAEATQKAIDGFEAKWAALVAVYAKAPPSHFAEDAQFAAVLEKIAGINQRAKSAARAGNLAEAHDVLEEIRGELGRLRLRNGMMTFSDRMDAVHAHMEHMIDRRKGDFSPAGLAELREDTAVLAFLADELKRHPAPEVSAPDFAPTLQALLDAIAAVQQAVRGGDAEAAKTALAKVKPAYARLFVKFG